MANDEGEDETEEANQKTDERTSKGQTKVTDDEMLRTTLRSQSTFLQESVS